MNTDINPVLAEPPFQTRERIREKQPAEISYGVQRQRVAMVEEQLQRCKIISQVILSPPVALIWSPSLPLADLHPSRLLRLIVETIPGESDEGIP